MFCLRIIIPIFFIISSTEVLASCFSFLPYAFNGQYVHLPKDLEFCYKKLDGEVFIKTNKDGGRLINYKKNSSKKRLLAFGDSQLLGIEFSQTNKVDQHDLEILFPESLMWALNQIPREVKDAIILPYNINTEQYCIARFDSEKIQQRIE